MTVIEKAERIREFCDDKGLFFCAMGCPLSDRNEEYGFCYSDCTKPDIIEENYKILAEKGALPGGDEK